MMLTRLLFTIGAMICCAAGNANNNQVLNQLDANLERKEEYEKEKTERISQKYAQLKGVKDDKQLFEAFHDLFEEYTYYKYDSAYAYAAKEVAVAERMKDSERMMTAKLDLAFCLVSSGLFKESFDVMETLSSHGLSEANRLRYYKMMMRVNDDIADYNRGEPFLSIYRKNAKLYTDSILMMVEADSPTAIYTIAMRHMKETNYDASVNYFELFLQSARHNDTTLEEKHLKAIVTSCLGWCYILKENHEEAIKYLAQAATYDNETVTKETTALCILAGLLYREGDVERATRYVQLALDDANFYDARHRIIQISEILPIIEKDRYHIMKSQRNISFVAMALALLILLLLGGAYHLIRKKSRKLYEAHLALDQSNLQLQDANENLRKMNDQIQQVNKQLQGMNKELKKKNAQLSDADRIKDGYIGQSFFFNSEYISKLEKLFKTIDRKISVHQYDELRSSLKESTLKDARENMYEAFDQTFTSVFPNFVDKYNAMLEKKHRVTPGNGKLTNEMRIFALIRLGISDSERIAGFLNYSVHTVNTYKTRVKNKALVDNEDFERLIMEI